MPNRNEYFFMAIPCNHKISNYLRMKQRILIIDDDQQSLYLLSFLLESNNYEVFQSDSGLDGIAKAREFKPDVIILDIQLPEMDGYQVAKLLRKNENFMPVTIIAVSSFAMIGDEKKALKAGANGYIEKPIDPNTFISQMKSFIPQSRN